MIITPLEVQRRDGLIRKSAQVIWEDSKRPERVIYFETYDIYEEYIPLNWDAFLVACVIPALEHGEQRIRIDESICPMLLDGLKTNMLWIKKWYKIPHDIPEIECTIRKNVNEYVLNRETASFLSGGIDSLCTLRLNHLNFSVDSPGRIKSGIIVHGFDIGGTEKDKDIKSKFEKTIKSLEEIAVDTKVDLIPVYTNIKFLDDEGLFWMYRFHGAALASVALFLSNRISTVLIGSSYDIPNIIPWGSHPILDQYYGSYELRIIHDGVRFSRLDKTKIVVNWQTGLNNIRVCVPQENGALNCGKCEKCVRTMFALDVLGVLNKTTAFFENQISPQMLRNVRIGSNYGKNAYLDLKPYFIKSGKTEIVKVINEKINEFNIYKIKRFYIDKLKEIDKNLTKGKLIEIWSGS